MEFDLWNIDFFLCSLLSFYCKKVYVAFSRQFPSICLYHPPTFFRVKYSLKIGQMSVLMSTEDGIVIDDGLITVDVYKILGVKNGSYKVVQCCYARRW